MNEKIRLVLLEDTVTAARRARQLLGDDFEVNWVRNPAVASDEIMRMIEADNAPQVLLTGMTLGKDYRDALPLIKLCRRDLPGIIIVAWSKQSIEVQQMALDAGANLSFSKYVDDDDMKNSILSLLGGPRTPRITFSYNDKVYEVELGAYDTERIVLPDGTLLCVNGWKEKHPPEPITLSETPHGLPKDNPQNIADTYGASMAQEKQ